MFSKPHGYHADFEAWIKKSIIHFDWTYYDDPVPDIFQIKVTWKERKDRGKMRNIPFIEAYSFEQAFAEAGRLGLVRNAGEPFYWVHKISGKEELYRYDFSSSLAYKNYQFAREEIRLGLYKELWFNQGFYDELLAITGEKGQSLYDQIMNIPGWADKMLSDKTVVFISMAQETFYLAKKSEAEKEEQRMRRTSDEDGFLVIHHSIFNENRYKPSGLLYDDFLIWVSDYRMLKEFSDSWRKELSDQRKAFDEEMMAKYGEPIGKNGEYYKYIRDGRALEVNTYNLFMLRDYIKEKNYWGIRDICGAIDPNIKEQQDLYYMLTWEERKVAIQAYSSCGWLWEIQETEVTMIMKNTPPDQRWLLKMELERNNKELYNNLKGLCENVATRREFYFVTEDILGYIDREPVNKVESSSNNFMRAELIIKMSQKQIAALSNTTYSNMLTVVLQDVSTQDTYKNAAVDLIIYASPAQQILATDILLKNNMAFLVSLKRELDEPLYNRLNNGEKISEPSADGEGMQQVQRGFGLSDILAKDANYKSTIKSMLSSYETYTSTPDNEIILAAVPETVIASLSDLEKANMIIFLARGANDDEMDEMTELRVIQVVIDTKDDAGRQAFYNMINTELDKVRSGIDGDNYADLEVKLSTLNKAGSQQRIEDVNNAGYTDVDEKISKLSEDDMATLDFTTRTEYINHIVGNGFWEEITTPVGYRDEKSLIRLINSTPVDHDQVVDLQKWLTAQNGERYYALESAIDGDEYKEFHDKLKEITERQMKSVASKDPQKMKEYYSQYREKELLGEKHEKGVPFNSPGSLKINYWKYLLCI